MDDFNRKIIETTFAVNEGLGPAGSGTIEKLQTVYPYAEGVMSVPNAELKDKLKEMRTSIGEAMRNTSGTINQQEVVEAQLKPVLEEQRYGK